LLNPEKTGRFLREGLFPIAHDHKVCLNVLHHIGKPPRDPNLKNGAMSELDYQYLGFGTSEIQNAFRAVNVLQSSGKGNRFKLVLSKRGERAGAKDIESEWTRELFIEHCRDGICWVQYAPDSDVEGTSDKFTKEDILEEMSVIHPLKTDAIYKRCYREKNAKRTSFYKLWGQLKCEKRIKQQEEGWIRCSNRQRTDGEPESYVGQAKDGELREPENEPADIENADPY
jgi:hypothetical protein